MRIDVVEEVAPDDHQPELLLARLGQKIIATTVGPSSSEGGIGGT